MSNPIFMSFETILAIFTFLIKLWLYLKAISRNEWSKGNSGMNILEVIHVKVSGMKNLPFS
jgi:hypothetical protein